VRLNYSSSNVRNNASLRLIRPVNDDQYTIV